MRGGPSRPLQREAVPSQLIHLDVCALALERRAAGGGRSGQGGGGEGADGGLRGAFWLGAMAPDAWGVAGGADGAARPAGGMGAGPARPAGGAAAGLAG